MTKQSDPKMFAREASNLVKEKAPAIVDEQILPHMLDEVREFTDDLFIKLNGLDMTDDTTILMVAGIIYDGLLNEVIEQIKTTMLDEVEKRFTTKQRFEKRLEKLSAKK